MSLSGGGPSGCPVVLGRPARMSESGRDALPEVQKWSEDPPGYPGVVGRPSRIFGSGRETLPDVQEWSDNLPDVRESHPDVWQ